MSPGIISKKMTSINIRKAVISDIQSIYKIIIHYSRHDLMLARPLSELYNHMREYFVLEKKDLLDTETARSDFDGKIRQQGMDKRGKKEGEIRGVCGLGIYWEDLAEIKSLAVCEDQQGAGWGGSLVKACLTEARQLGIQKIFTLTSAPDFFIKSGFKVVDKSVLPQKIWADCVKCPKFPDNCDETALTIDL